MSAHRPPLLLIDDDQELAELLDEYLSAQGYQVEAVQNGEEGVHRALGGQHALVVLDVMLPGIDGFEVLRRIRAQSAMPVLMLTARGEDVDRIIGLELGADDYLPKPFNPRELAARVRAILRRAEQRTQQQAAGGNDAPLVVGDIVLTPRTREVRQSGRLVTLTATEFDLLEALLRTAGQVVGRNELFRQVLGREPEPLDRSIDMHISHLRKKLGHTHSGVDRIKAIRGVGYIYTSVEPNG